ncbi:MAG: hypothetical protein U5K32_13495 [Bacteroidales bacterium]|nr:hypothetical protein [Bacteroidales bacterium]
MENLNLNLSKNEFSKSRKILLWIIGLLFFSGAIWSLYLKLYKDDSSVTAGLIVVLFAISSFIFFIAALASVKKKNHYFIIDNDRISYRYGLVFSKQRSLNWSEIKEIIIQYNLRKATIITGDDKQKFINLNWINHSSARAILKHLYYTARKKNISISKT